MKDLIKKLPVPSAGLMLGLAAGGNLVVQLSPALRLIMGGISAIIFILLALKLIMFRAIVAKELENPLIASVSPTFSMGIMLLSVYIKPFAPDAALAMWIAAISIHIGLILFFSRRYLLHFNKDAVMPSWFVVYVGIAAASVTSPAFSMKSAGQAFFWVGMIGYLLLLPFVIRKLGKINTIPEPALPSITIFCAPASLLLAGYMNSFDSKSLILIAALVIVSQLSYLYVLTKLPSLLKFKFYPSYSALTFPMVITATSIKAASNYFEGLGSLKHIAAVETFIASIMVFYVLIRYIRFLRPEKFNLVDNTSI